MKSVLHLRNQTAAPNSKVCVYANQKKKKKRVWNFFSLLWISLNASFFLFLRATTILNWVFLSILSQNLSAWQATLLWMPKTLITDRASPQWGTSKTCSIILLILILATAKSFGCFETSNHMSWKCSSMIVLIKRGSSTFSSTLGWGGKKKRISFLFFLENKLRTFFRGKQKVCDGWKSARLYC